MDNSSYNTPKVIPQIETNARLNAEKIFNKFISFILYELISHSNIEIRRAIFEYAPHILTLSSSFKISINNFFYCP